MPSSILKCSSALLLISLQTVVGADRYPTFTDAETAGPDFAIQGEYVGLVGDVTPVGAQVIALGNGQFEGVMFRGGLPGAGWDRMQRRYFRGETDGNVTRFHGVQGYKLEEVDEMWHATIRDGQLIGADQAFRNASQDDSFALRKVLRKSPTLGARPPAGARILFNGQHTDAWENAEIVEQTLLDRGAKSLRSFRDVHVHLEFRTPFMPTARGMHRGNSGVFLRNKYEIQIVDSFGWTFINRRFVRNSWVGRSGGIEEILPPDVNMSYPPLSWQTYDVDYWTSRTDDDGAQISPPLMTVRHNGVVIHDRRVLPPEAEVRPDREAGPLYLQQHHDRVVFRNIWAVEAPE